MTDFVIHASGPKGGKFIVRGVGTASGIGVYSEAEGRSLVPSYTDMENLIPYRWKKALRRHGGAFWFEKEARINLEGRLVGRAPHLTLTDYRGRPLTTLYALPAQQGGR